MNFKKWVKSIQTAGYNGKRAVLKRNHCIFRIRGAPVCQILGMISENEVVQKLKLEKKSFLQEMVS
jgi:hypothetical protein